jgi:hypothetical protein
MVGEWGVGTLSSHPEDGAANLIHPRGCGSVVEHHLAKVRVAGSNPVIRSKNFQPLNWANLIRARIGPLALAHHGPLFAHHEGGSGQAVRVDTVKGSIRQRGSGSFELRVHAGTDPATKRRRWITRTVRGSRADALHELKALAAHANIAPAVGARTTVAELLDLWFARGRTGWSPTTVRNLGSIIDRHLKPQLSDFLVGDLTTALVDQFYEHLRMNGGIGHKPLAVGTVRRIHSTLHAALDQAQRWSWVFDNVADHASPPRGEPTEMRPPTPSEVARLLQFVANDPPLHLYLTATTTGARRGQLLALRWIDVDLVSGNLSEAYPTSDFYLPLTLRALAPGYPTL